MADPTLTFAGWTREKLADLVSGSSGGRATGTASVTLTGTDAGGTATGRRVVRSSSPWPGRAT